MALQQPAAAAAAVDQGKLHRPLPPSLLSFQLLPFHTHATKEKAVGYFMTRGPFEKGFWGGRRGVQLQVSGPALPSPAGRRWRQPRLGVCVLEGCGPAGPS